MEQLSRKADPEQTLVDVDADQIDAFYFFAPDEVLDQQMKMAADTRTDQIAVFEVSHPEEAPPPFEFLLNRSVSSPADAASCS